MRLTGDYLIAHGWREASGSVWKDFKDWKNEKYRMGWNPKTHILYMGYGQAPIKIDTKEELLRILGAFLFVDEMLNLMR